MCSSLPFKLLHGGCSSHCAGRKTVPLNEGVLEVRGGVGMEIWLGCHCLSVAGLDKWATWARGLYMETFVMLKLGPSPVNTPCWRTVVPMNGM